LGARDERRKTSNIAGVAEGKGFQKHQLTFKRCTLHQLPTFWHCFIKIMQNQGVSLFLDVFSCDKSGYLYLKIFKFIEVDLTLFSFI
jgi:hypothetical protein